MTDAQQREAARQFFYKWNGKGREDEDARSYSLPHRKEGDASIDLSAGQYTFSYETDISLRPGYSIDSLILDLLQAPEIQKALPMLTQIPEHDRSCTLRQFAQRYSDRISPEMLQRLDQMLKQF